MFDDNGSGPPLTVLVTESRWDAVDEPTERNIWLTKMLKELGGINYTVPPGTYNFNIERVENQMIATLEPAPR